MKKVVLLLLLLLLPIALAKTDTFVIQKGESHQFYGKNITLLGTNEKQGSVLLCINNEKRIQTGDKEEKGLFIELRGVKENYTIIKASYDCKGSACECTSSCKNDKCFDVKDMCEEDNDCDDDNPLTIDTCEGIPKVCSYVPKPALECTQNADCNDNLICTENLCINNKCSFKPILDCTATPEKESSAQKIFVILLISIAAIIFVLWRFKAFKERAKA